MILLESRTKILPQVKWHVLFYRTNEVCFRNIRGVTERHCL